jgi:acetyltransferase-like isoleucine patch superfamily enzyme
MRINFRQFIALKVQYLRYSFYKLQGYDIQKSTQMERGLNLDRINPKGIHIGKNTIITSRVTILSHYLESVYKQQVVDK